MLVTITLGAVLSLAALAGLPAMQLRTSQDATSDAVTTGELWDPRTSTDDGVIAAGTWGTATWSLDARGALHIGPGIGVNTPAWVVHQTSITEITFTDPAGTVLPDDRSFLFAGLPSVTAINGIGDIDVSNVTNTTGMFWEAARLQHIDVSGWDASNVTANSSMFFGVPGVGVREPSCWTRIPHRGLDRDHGAVDTREGQQFSRGTVGEGADSCIETTAQARGNALCPTHQRPNG